MRPRTRVCFAATLCAILMFQRDAQARGGGVLGWLHKLSGPGPFLGASLYARAPLSSFQFSLSLPLLGLSERLRNDLEYKNILVVRALAELDKNGSSVRLLELLREIEDMSAVEDKFTELLGAMQNQGVSLSPDLEAMAEQFLIQLHAFTLASASINFGETLPGQRRPSNLNELTALRASLVEMDPFLRDLEDIVTLLTREALRQQDEGNGPCTAELEAMKKCRVKHWLGMRFGARATTERSHETAGGDTWIWWLLAENYYEHAPSSRVSLMVGYAFNYFAGKEFENFWRGSITVPRVRVDIGKGFFVDAELNYFSTQFTDTDFGGPPVPRPSGGEWVPSVALGYRLGNR